MRKYELKFYNFAMNFMALTSQELAVDISQRYIVFKIVLF